MITITVHTNLKTILTIRPCMQKRNSKQRRGSRANPQSGTLIVQPSPFISGRVMPWKARWFVKTALTTATFSPAQFIYSLLGMAVTTTSYWPIFGAARLRRIKIWVPPLAANVEVATFSWDDVTTAVFAPGPTKIYCSTSTGASSPALLEIRPTRGSRGASWLATDDTTVLFILTAPVNSIVEMDCDVSLDLNNTTGSALAVTGVTVGNLYALGMDGAQLSMTKLTVVGPLQA